MRESNIRYSQAEPPSRHMLDVIYDPAAKETPVIIFIHGGSWMSGSKDMYTKLGENFLALGYTTVLVNYRLSPQATVADMTDDCQEALEWILRHISAYGGSAQKLFMMGHSAGGHLAAVTAMHNALKVKGMILDDAFGLSAYHFMTTHAMWIPEFLSNIFGSDAELWKRVSPDVLIRKECPGAFILTGANTYPFILYDNQHFKELAEKAGISVTQHFYAGKSHMAMIYMFESHRATVYKDVTGWIEDQLSSL